MTVALDYESLVTKTFCENAIRSVMMIDDEFIPYSKLIQELTIGNTIPSQALLNSQRAAALESFFQNKRILCDLDDSAGHIDVERIRKSDLLIIDYHLQDQNPKKTIEILSGLKNSPHFNLAVVYTNEPLEIVWKQIAASLTPYQDIISRIQQLDIDEVTDFWDEIIKPDFDTSGGLFSLNNNEFSDYLLNKKVPGRLNRELASYPDIKPYISILGKLICDNHIQLNQIYLSSENNNDYPIFGDKNGVQWIHSKNLFVCIHKKNTDFENDPQNILETLHKSLIDWRPSYYQLIQSEIQNQIESESMSFNVIHQNDSFGQAAWLKEILKSDNESLNGKIKTIYSSLAEDLFFRFSENEELKIFIKNIFSTFKDQFHQRSDEQPDLEIFCAEKMGITINAETTKDMYHALNMNLSSKNYREKHISTGTILFDEVNNDWYLCVSAACDMVPTQETAPINKRLTPHRMIQVIKLFHVDAKQALENATRSKYIYTFENGKRLYFSVTNPETDHPVIDYLVILNYKNKLDERFHEAMIFQTNGDDIGKIKISLKLKSQLRTGYAERFQNMASHHYARIGVDFINGLESLKDMETKIEG